MSGRKKLASVHFASTFWFVLCVGYILILTLHQAGIKWWIVFSLSGPGFIIALVLISLYLFAIFRGISSSQKVMAEHPLTSSIYYAFFYVSTPFLGGLAGCLGMIGSDTLSRFLLGISLGTLGATFFVWVVIDPFIGLVELLLPASRKHYILRTARAKAERARKQKNNRILLAQVAEKERTNRLYWQELLRPQAEELANLLITDNLDFRKAERQAIGIGAYAWQIGGLNCMRELRNMAIGICRQKYNNHDIIDYITCWWDGIGNWRNPSFM